MAIDPAVPRTRRNLLAAGAAGLAGLLFGGLAKPAEVDGTTGPMVFGTSMDAGVDATTLTSTAASTAVFQNSGSGVPVQGVASGGQAGVLGTNFPGGNGVVGETSNGNGVQGLSTSGNGVQGLTTTGIGVNGIATSGLGVVGTSTSSIGVIGGSSAAGEPGVYGQSAGDNTGVLGVSGGSSFTLPVSPPAKTGVYGFANQDATAVGVMGDSPDGRGVVGHSVIGAGVVGWTGITAPTPGIDVAVLGANTSGGHDLYAGGSGRIGFVPNVSSGPPATNSYATGDVLCDAAGNLWVCVSGGTPGTFRKLAGPTTAGALHPILATRVYDSRLSGGALSGTGFRTISVATAIVGGGAAPSGSIAVAYNLTITGTVGSGWLSPIPHGATFGGTSAINWFGPGQTLANGGIVGLGGDRQLDVHIGGLHGSSTQFIVDVTGYYL